MQKIIKIIIILAFTILPFGCGLTVIASEPSDTALSKNANLQEKSLECLEKIKAEVFEKEAILNNLCYQKSLINFTDKMIDNSAEQKSIIEAKNRNQDFDNRLGHDFSAIGITAKELEVFQAKQNKAKDLETKDLKKSNKSQNNEDSEGLNPPNKIISGSENEEGQISYNSHKTDEKKTLLHKNSGIYSNQEVLLLRKIYTERCIENFRIKIDQYQKNASSRCGLK
jgi:hypothetical protein